MTKEEYKTRLKELEREFNVAKSKLAGLYANENNPYRVGDVFTDHIGSIKVLTITNTTGYATELPYCVYSGIELKKDGTPTKRETIRNAYQTNELKPINQ